jgi:phosphotransferase system HPr (HPr) family protein
MTEAQVTIVNETGLHARPAALFVRTAAKFDAAVRVRNTTRGGEREADGKSIVSLMTLGVRKDDEILIRAEGDDEAEAIQTLTDLVASGFQES